MIIINLFVTIVQYCYIFQIFNANNSIHIHFMKISIKIQQICMSLYQNLQLNPDNASLYLAGTKSCDDAISYVMFTLQSINNYIQQHKINNSQSFMNNWIIVQLFAILVVICNGQLVRLFRLSLQIDDNCWIIDTNNLTQIGMGNCQDQVYYVNLGLGTPPSFANFQIDIQRDSIWYPLNQTYANQSQTFQITNRTTVTYMHKSIYEGSVGSDIVTIQSTNISTRSSVVWADKDLDLPTQPQIGGILGLGFSSTPNFLDNAAQNNQIQSSVFALQMGGLGQPSVLYYNQLPSFLQISTIYVPVTSSQLWQIQVANVRIGGYDYSEITSNKMIIDTTTSMLYINEKLYNKLMNKFFMGCRVQSNNKPICPCQGNYPLIQFIFSDVSITIQSDSYFQRQQGSCILMIGRTLNQQSPIMMGGSLLRNYILTFDKQNKQVGFNGNSLGIWRKLFVIFQLIMILIALLALGLGIYLLMIIRYIKQQKLQKKINKAKKSSKPAGKTKSQKQKLLVQLTSQFLQQS